jgi:hypothetical protein
MRVIVTAVMRHGGVYREHVFRFTLCRDCVLQHADCFEVDGNRPCCERHNVAKHVSCAQGLLPLSDVRFLMSYGLEALVLLW